MADKGIGVKPRSDKKRHLEFNFQLLNFFGLCPADNRPLPLKSWQFIRTLLPPLQIARSCCALIVNGVSMYVLWNEPLLRIDRIAACVGSVVVIGKLGTLMYHKNGIANVFNTLELLNEEDYYVDDKCENLRKIALKWCETLSKIISYFFFIIGPVIYISGRHIVFDLCMKPLKILFYEKTYWFFAAQYVSLVILFSSTFEMFTMVVLDVTALVMFLQSIMQFHILGYKLENIRTIVKNTLEARAACELVKELKENLENSIEDHEKEKETSIGSIMSLNEVPSDDTVLDKGHGPFVISRENSRKSLVYIDIPQGDIEIEMEKYLKSCVKHHELLLKCCSEMQRIFNPALLSQMLLTVTLSMMALHISILSSKEGGVGSKIVIGVFYTIAATTETFIMCIICDKLTQKSAGIRDAVYACDWLDSTEEFKRSLRIIMARTSKPVVIKAAGITLSLRSFKAMMRAVYYIHTFSLNIINGKKINHVE